MNRLRVVAAPALPQGVAGPDDDLAGRLYIQPTGIVAGPAAEAAVAAGNGWPLAGGPLVFTACMVLLRDRDRVVETLAPFAEVLDWSTAEGGAVAEHVAGLIHRIGARRAGFAGLPDDRPLVMGVVNVTPDSFSDGGAFLDPSAAVAHGAALLAAGADILDIGGESTRPGAAPVSPGEEMARVLPVIRELAQRGAVVSVDTRHAPTMAAAVAAGARIVNDVSALGGPDALPVAASSGLSVILMHMQGEPRSMQADPVYDFAPLDVYEHLAARIAACVEAGIAAERLCVDPGIGFGKNLEHNTQVLARLTLLHGLGCPVLLGASRKSFIAGLSGGTPVGERLPGSLAAALAGLRQGVRILRVHDVVETVQAVRVWQAIA